MAKAPTKYYGINEQRLKSIETKRKTAIREIFGSQKISQFWDEEFLLAELKANIKNETPETQRRLEASGL